MEEDHNRVSQQWVSQVLAFFYSVWPLVVGFGLLEFVAAALFKDPNTALVGATLIFFASLMLVCKWITTRGRPQAAVALLCAGFLVCTLFVALVARGITPTLALTPFLAFGIALPFFDDATLKRIAVAVWLCSVLAVLLGDPVIHSQLRSLEWYSRWSSSAPDWYVAVFRLASLATASGVVLVLLWRFRIWINDQTLRRIREAEQRYSLVERGSNDGLWDWDIKSGQIYLSARFSEMLGLVAEVCQGPVEDASWLLERLHPEDRQPLRTRVRDHLAGVSEYFVSEHRMRHDDGAYRWMLVRGQAVRDSQGGATRMAGSQTDVTRRRLAEDRAHHDALHDPLTGLANRKLFSDRLCEAVSRSRTGGGGAFSLLFLDLDRFKSVNDSLGHGAGDELLVCVAERLTSCVSRSDTVARLGGDEFVVLLDGLGETALAEGVAQRLLARLQEPFTVGGHTVLVTASIGVLPGTETVCGGMPSRAGRTARGNETLLRDADTAMYHAKEAGKSRFATFEPRMREETLSLLSLETDLRAAIEGSEFTVAYQPIVWLASGEVVGFEALARWWHAERGQVSPEIFVTLAQDLGLVHRIDCAVLREACRTMAQLRCQRPDGYPISVSVNLSPAQLDRPGLLEEVDAALQENGLPGEALKLELTETAVMGDFVAATRTLSRLKALGVGIHIDDFGTGHSSLALLYRLPADALKIDRTFITGLSGPDTVPADNDELVQTIVHLGHQLGLEVVAEGVETDAQLGRLRQIGCDYAQGFRFSRPVPAREAATILEAEPRW